MRRLVNRSIQLFLRDTYGPQVWRDVAAAAGAPAEGFEVMLRYPPEVTSRLLDAATARLGRRSDCLLEDMGTYLATHENTAALRRLLRFGGITFADFLFSLEDLPDRGRLALPDLDLPSLELEDEGERLRLVIRDSDMPGIGHVLVGLMRALADDYGALAVFEHAEVGGAEVVTIQLLDQRFSEGRRFRLVPAVA